MISAVDLARVRAAADLVAIAGEHTQLKRVGRPLIRQGLPPAAAAGAEQIFERFGRLDEARGSETGGTGLGLAIAAEIVERHGGTLVLANPGQPGAVFELSLPLPG